MQQQVKKKKWRKAIKGGKVYFYRLSPLKSKQRKYTYDEWWQEKNLDGSFAYNGVTDDF